MAFKRKYDAGTWRIFVGLIFTGLLIAGFTSKAEAQVFSWGPSVTSMNFGGSHHLGGIPPSVTSLGFGQMGGRGWRGSGWDGRPHFQPPMFSTSDRDRDRDRDRDSWHHRPYYPIWGGYYGYPIFDYGYSNDNQYPPSSANNSENPDEYKGGPTIFDRRGNGQYPRPGAEQPVQQSIETSALPAPASIEKVANQPQTVLIFKDGHQVKVDNYAIVGSTLYDLTGGMRHKIALADLDLNATAQQNDDRGVDFELPANSAAN